VYTYCELHHYRPNFALFLLFSGAILQDFTSDFRTLYLTGDATMFSSIVPQCAGMVGNRWLLPHCYPPALCPVRRWLLPPRTYEGLHLERHSRRGACNAQSRFLAPGSGSG
jgi:hypothetical protein